MTVVQSLANMACSIDLDSMPSEVVEDSKRVLLDSIGCSLAGVDSPKGRAGVGVGRLIGGRQTGASIVGTRYMSTVFGAAYANGETINALDYDTVLPPGHVAPYVLPGALALAESANLSGRRLLEGIAVAHEVSYRFGKAMDYHRTPRGEEMHLPEVLGFTSTVFGATLSNCMMLGLDVESTADAVGIAAAITPVNSHRAWIEHLPNSSIKYTMAGPVVQSGLVAAFASNEGHSGDRQILDDRAFGYARYIGTGRWEHSAIEEDLGVTWHFPAAHIYKPYPHCRVTHGSIDALLELVTHHDIQVQEIDAIRCWGEAWVDRDLWLNTDVSEPHEAQMSYAFALAVAAHRFASGTEWQTPSTLSNPSVHKLMQKVKVRPHPEYVRLLSQDPTCRPTRVEIDARGSTFVAESMHPKGTPSTDERTYMTTAELVGKFRDNARGVLSEAQIDALIDGILGLERVESVQNLASLMRVTSRSDSSAPSQTDLNVFAEPRLTDDQ